MVMIFLGREMYVEPIGNQPPAGAGGGVDDGQEFVSLCIYVAIFSV